MTAIQSDDRSIPPDFQTNGGARISRRRTLGLLWSGATVALLAACSGSSGPTASAPTPASGGTSAAPTPPPAAAATAAPPAAPGATAAPTAAVAPTTNPSAPTQPVSGGTLRVVRLADIARLDGHLTTGADTTWMVFDRLTAYDEKVQPQPMLAESWEISPDYRRIKLNLRKGVQYHSGREFTSDDVKWNVLRVRDPKAGAGALTNQSNWFNTIDTPDKATVVLSSEQPRPLVFDMFEYFNMLDRESMEGPRALQSLVGTGPFTFVEWAQGDHLTFGKNANYWRSGRPFIDGVQVGIAKDPQAAVTQLEAGSIDVALGMPLRDFTRLKADPKYQALLVPGTVHVMGVNVLNAPFDNKQVRQAMNYAIDRKRFVETTLAGTVPAQSLPWLPSSVAFEPAKADAFRFDLDKARALLAEAGLSDLAIETLYSPQYPELLEFAQAYQADLAKIGVKMTIVNLDQAAWLDRVNNRKYTGMYASVINYATLEPVTIISSSRHFDPSGNNTGYKSDQYSQLFNSASVEPDAAKRKQIYGQLNDLLLDESFAMPMAPASTRVTARGSVHGLVTSQHNVLLYNDVWLDANRS